MRMLQRRPAFAKKGLLSRTLLEYLGLHTDREQPGSQVPVRYRIATFRKSQACLAFPQPLRRHHVSGVRNNTLVVTQADNFGNGTHSHLKQGL